MVYILFDGTYYKIGHTTSSRYKQRLLNLSTGNSQELTLIAYIETPFPKELEKQLHRKFAPNRVRREWYWLDYLALDELKRILSLGKEGSI